MAPTGTIFDIKKFAIHDGPGIRTTVFFKGCPLDCHWCHNPESRLTGSETRPLRKKPACLDDEVTIGCDLTISQVMTEICKDRIFYDQSGGGATFSGGEPMLQIDFLEALLRACRKDGIHTVVDTSGHIAAEHFARIYDLVDLFLYDIKLMDPELHRQYVGVDNELILSNLTALAKRGSTIEIRIPLVPGLSDTDDNLRLVVDFLEPLPRLRRIALLPYNKLGDDKLERYGLDSHRRPWDSPANGAYEDTKRWLTSLGYTVKIGG